MRTNLTMQTAKQNQEIQLNDKKIIRTLGFIGTALNERT